MEGKRELSRDVVGPGGNLVVKRVLLYAQSSKLFHKTGVATERHAYKGIWLYTSEPEASDQNRAPQ